MQQNLTPVGYIQDLTEIDQEVLPPIVRTLENHHDMFFGEVFLSGELLSDGNSDFVERGFLISENLRFDFPERQAFFDTFTNSNLFEVRLHHLEPGKSYYYRAYAMNEAGETLGNIKKVTIPDHYSMGDSWEMIPPVEGGWRESHWFGAFLLMDNDWMYHAELGWIYTQSDHFGGHWIWLESHGWLWTQEHTWPYLYSHATASWLYYIKSLDGLPIFFNYQQNHYEYLPY